MKEIIRKEYKASVDELKELFPVGTMSSCVMDFWIFLNIWIPHSSSMNLTTNLG